LKNIEDKEKPTSPIQGEEVVQGKTKKEEVSLNNETCSCLMEAR
jgi:hypothetical protein